MSVANLLSEELSVESREEESRSGSKMVSIHSYQSGPNVRDVQQNEIEQS